MTGNNSVRSLASNPFSLKRQSVLEPYSSVLLGLLPLYCYTSWDPHSLIQLVYWSAFHYSNPGPGARYFMKRGHLLNSQLWRPKGIAPALAWLWRRPQNGWPRRGGGTCKRKSSHPQTGSQSREPYCPSEGMTPDDFRTSHSAASLEDSIPNLPTQRGPNRWHTNPGGTNPEHIQAIIQSHPCLSIFFFCPGSVCNFWKFFMLGILLSVPCTTSDLFKPISIFLSRLIYSIFWKNLGSDCSS